MHGVERTAIVKLRELHVPTSAPPRIRRLFLLPATSCGRGLSGQSSAARKRS
jgi:hypothetical protein